jgi:hypothetical protein
MGIQIHHLKDRSQQSDEAGPTPELLIKHGFKVYKYVDHEKVAARIEEAARSAGK